MAHSLGQRRKCDGCSRAFYDLDRTPILCPNCGIECCIQKETTDVHKNAHYPLEEEVFDDEESDDFLDGLL